jgi:hypothetical protein
MPAKKGDSAKDAGRPPIDADKRRKPISATVDPVTFQLLKIIAERRSQSLGRFLDSIATMLLRTPESKPELDEALLEKYAQKPRPKRARRSKRATKGTDAAGEPSTP